MTIALPAVAEPAVAEPAAPPAPEVPTALPPVLGKGFGFVGGSVAEQALSEIATTAATLQVKGSPGIVKT